MKELAWRGGGDGPWYAQTPFGWLTIYWHRDPSVKPKLWLLRDSPSYHVEGKVIKRLGKFADVDEAKSAAAAWYEEAMGPFLTSPTLNP